MNIESKRKNNVLFVRPEGRIDMETAPELEKFIKENTAGVKAFEFDLRNVEYISSAGLRVFMRLKKQRPDDDGFVTIKNMNKTVRSIFDLTGFTDMFIIK